MSAKYDFYIDRKVSVWSREQLSIEAESEDQALQKAIQIAKTGDSEESTKDYNYIIDTENAMKAEDDIPTVEVYKKDTDEMVFDNINGIIPHIKPEECTKHIPVYNPLSQGSMVCAKCGKILVSDDL